MIPLDYVTSLWSCSCSSVYKGVAMLWDWWWQPHAIVCLILVSFTSYQHSKVIKERNSLESAKYIKSKSRAKQKSVWMCELLTCLRDLLVPFSRCFTTCECRYRLSLYGTCTAGVAVFFQLGIHTGSNIWLGSMSWGLCPEIVRVIPSEWSILML